MKMSVMIPNRMQLLLFVLIYVKFHTVNSKPATIQPSIHSQAIGSDDSSRTLHRILPINAENIPGPDQPANQPSKSSSHNARNPSKEQIISTKNQSLNKRRRRIRSISNPFSMFSKNEQNPTTEKKGGNILGNIENKLSSLFTSSKGTKIDKMNEEEKSENKIKTAELQDFSPALSLINDKSMVNITQNMSKTNDIESHNTNKKNHSNNPVLDLGEHGNFGQKLNYSPTNPMNQLEPISINKNELNLSGNDNLKSSSGNDINANSTYNNSQSVDEKKYVSPLENKTPSNNSSPSTSPESISTVKDELNMKTTQIGKTKNNTIDNTNNNAIGKQNSNDQNVGLNKQINTNSSRNISGIESNIYHGTPAANSTINNADGQEVARGKNASSTFNAHNSKTQGNIGDEIITGNPTTNIENKNSISNKINNNPGENINTTIGENIMNNTGDNNTASQNDSKQQYPQERGISKNENSLDPVSIPPLDSGETRDHKDERTGSVPSNELSGDNIKVQAPPKSISSNNSGDNNGSTVGDDQISGTNKSPVIPGMEKIGDLSSNKSSDNIASPEKILNDSLNETNNRKVGDDDISGTNGSPVIPEEIDRTGNSPSNETSSSNIKPLASAEKISNHNLDDTNNGKVRDHHVSGTNSSPVIPGGTEGTGNLPSRSNIIQETPGIISNDNLGHTNDNKVRDYQISGTNRSSDIPEGIEETAKPKSNIKVQEPPGISNDNLSYTNDSKVKDDHISGTNRSSDIPEIIERTGNLSPNGTLSSNTIVQEMPGIISNDNVDHTKNTTVGDEQIFGTNRSSDIPKGIVESANPNSNIKVQETPYNDNLNDTNDSKVKDYHNSGKNKSLVIPSGINTSPTSYSAPRTSNPSAFIQNNQTLSTSNRSAQPDMKPLQGLTNSAYGEEENQFNSSRNDLGENILSINPKTNSLTDTTSSSSLTKGTSNHMAQSNTTLSQVSPENVEASENTSKQNDNKDMMGNKSMKVNRGDEKDGNIDNSNRINSESEDATMKNAGEIEKDNRTPTNILSLTQQKGVPQSDNQVVPRFDSSKGKNSPGNGNKGASNADNNIFDIPYTNDISEEIEEIPYKNEINSDDKIDEIEDIIVLTETTASNSNTEQSNKVQPNSNRSSKESPENPISITKPTIDDEKPPAKSELPIKSTSTSIPKPNLNNPLEVSTETTESTNKNSISTNNNIPQPTNNQINTEEFPKINENSKQESTETPDPEKKECEEEKPLSELLGSALHYGALGGSAGAIGAMLPQILKMLKDLFKKDDGKDDKNNKDGENQDNANEGGQNEQTSQPEDTPNVLDQQLTEVEDEIMDKVNDKIDDIEDSVMDTIKDKLTEVEDGVIGNLKNQILSGDGTLLQNAKAAFVGSENVFQDIKGRLKDVKNDLIGDIKTSFTSEIDSNDSKFISRDLKQGFGNAMDKNPCFNVQMLFLNEKGRTRRTSWPATRNDYLGKVNSVESIDGTDIANIQADSLSEEKEVDNKEIQKNKDCDVPEVATKKANVGDLFKKLMKK